MESEPFELELQLAISASALPVQQNAPATPVKECMAPMRESDNPGDPGDTETFGFPDHAYLYLVWNDGSDTHIVSQSLPLAEGNWVPGDNELIYVSKGDPVYLYKQKVIFLLEGQTRNWARLYVAVSKEDIAPYVKGSDPKKTSPTSETDVQNLVFDNNTTTIQSNLQNIYSTPYNYEVDSKYYGTVANFAYDPSSDTGPRVAYANLLLYHVAAKVDVMWNVKTDLQSTMKVSYLEAENLYDGDCLLFRPNENEVTAAKYTSGYSEVLTQGTSLAPNIGTQWNGREYFYTIPYKNNASPKKFPLQLRMLKNTDYYDAERANADYYHMVKSTDMPSGAIFVPWVRCQININKVLEYSATPVEF
ncbi:MAG: hypothetical protein IKO66_05170 [Paludibacteraceae bacterium]|nr:hypothetical protein [Paludibacteraceae bacterium]